MKNIAEFWRQSKNRWLRTIQAGIAPKSLLCCMILFQIRTRERSSHFFLDTEHCYRRNILSVHTEHCTGSFERAFRSFFSSHFSNNWKLISNLHCLPTPKLLMSRLHASKAPDRTTKCEKADEFAAWGMLRNWPSMIFQLLSATACSSWPPSPTCARDKDSVMNLELWLALVTAVNKAVSSRLSCQWSEQKKYEYLSHAFPVTFFLESYRIVLIKRPTGIISSISRKHLRNRALLKWKRNTAECCQRKVRSTMVYRDRQALKLQLSCARSWHTRPISWCCLR